MTTVEHYRPTHIFPSDAPSNARRSYPISKSIAKIPPAVPSPPRLSRDSPPQKPQLRGEQIASFKMASSDSNQWLFTDEELRSTPSILHGIDPKLERQQRAKGTNFILQAAILLKIPQITIGVASTFLHRFYMRASMDSKKGYHHYVCPLTPPRFPPCSKLVRKL
jgi:protein BUR2